MNFVAIFTLLLINLTVVNCVVTFQLYTRMNLHDGQPLIYKDSKSIKMSHFNRAKKNKILIHGFSETGTSQYNRELKEAFLFHEDYNVIVVDWATVATKNYTHARLQVGPVGKAVMQFIEWLKLDHGFVHLLGFDLGAHVAGIAGKNTKIGQLDKITGFDPSQEGYNIHYSLTRLAAGDARYVEVYHSNGGKLGIMQPIGMSDKYFHDGKTQPNCKTDWCSHEYCWRMYNNLILGYVYRTHTCTSVEDLDGKGCSASESEWHGEQMGIMQIITKNGYKKKLKTQDVNEDEVVT